MALWGKNKKERTPKQKAERAQMNIAVRLIGCAWLVKIIIDLLRNEEDPVSALSPWKIALIAVLMLAGGVIIVLTVIDFIRSLKSGYYSARAHGAESPAEPEPESEEPAAISAPTEEDAEPEEPEETEANPEE
ncbi:MAG: hypothetical protein LBT12_03845 [Oscillospiraceae bacterium]|jgi:hypothetical protein|nr:hypothetical protein [Oscillospiraceae bacterium]